MRRAHRRVPESDRLGRRMGGRGGGVGLGSGGGVGGNLGGMFMADGAGGTYSSPSK